MKLKSITYGAVSLVIIIISFNLFRGSINIFNSIVVPLTLYIYFKMFNLLESISIVITLLIIIMLFFIQQLVFIVLYIIISLILVLYSKINLNKYIKIIILSLGLALGFYLSIYLTDLFLGTNILNVLLTIVNYNNFRLLILFCIEGLFVGIVLNFTIKILNKKLYFLN
ncbi:MAG: hypothetical protein U5K53_03600 [Halanaerobiales bacterium]|nr:hypothetical protein [Halanaerobiales bacterium]